MSSRRRAKPRSPRWTRCARNSRPRALRSRMVRGATGSWWSMILTAISSSSTIRPRLRPTRHNPALKRWANRLLDPRSLEEIDRLHVADVAHDVDISLGQEIVDQQNVLGDVIDTKIAALGYIFDGTGHESLQTIHVAVVRRDNDRAICDFEDGEAATNFSDGIVDVADVGAVVRSDEDLVVGSHVHAVMVAVGDYGTAGDCS